MPLQVERKVKVNTHGKDQLSTLLERQGGKSGYHLFVDNFYSSLTLFKDLFAHGFAATGTILETRRDFPVNLKKIEKNGLRTRIWERDPPCLVLQWVNNKVV